MMHSTAPRTLLLGTILAGSLLSVAHAADFSEVPAGAYVSDDVHAYLNFSYNHLGLSNPTLSFDDFTVDLDLDVADPTKSTLTVSIDPSSILTGSEIWKEHLVGEKFFDVANHPEITFQSNSIEAAGEGAYNVMGDLTIKGTAVPVTMGVNINAAKNHPMSGDPIIGLDASGEVLRSEFGFDTAVPFVSDEVAINITVEMLKVAE